MVTASLTRVHGGIRAALIGLCLVVPSVGNAALLSADDRTRYRAAFEAAEAKDWTRALALADAARDPLPGMVLRWHNYNREKSGAGFTEIVDFLLRHPHWPKTRRMRLRVEEAMTEGEPDSLVLEWFRDNEPIGPRGAMAYAKALENAALPWVAESMVRESWTRMWFTANQQKRFLKRFGHLLTSDDHARRLDHLLWNQRRSEASRMLPLVDSGTRAVARARIKLMAQRPGVDDAIRAVPQTLQADPGLVFERLRWRRRKGFEDQAVDLLRDPPPVLVRPDKWWRERHYLAREAIQRGEVTEAYALASDHRVPNGKAFAEGEFLAGWIASRFLRDQRAAYTHFTRLFRGVSFPISLARGAYWAGRAAEAHGDSRLARGWYETAAQYVTTYYGQLGAAQVGARIAPPIPDAPEPSTRSRQQFENRELVRALRASAEVHDGELLTPLLRHLVREIERADDAVLVAQLSEQVGRPDMALSAAKQAVKIGVTLVEQLFPVIPVPNTASPEPALVLALIRQESAYRRTAVSRAGARGLMQLMPRTAQVMANRLGLPYSRARLTQDPDYNMRLGTGYLDWMLEKWDGSYILALASYNAGPHRAERWIREYGDPRDPTIDPVDWVEMIPFGETRNYVQRVLESAQIYRNQLQGTRMALRLHDDLSR